MSRISHRVDQIKPSPTIMVTMKSMELKAQGKDIVSLGFGEPDFDTPEHIREAAIQAIRDGKTRYTQVDGTPELKTAIIKKFHRDNELEFEPGQILVSNGAKQSLYNLLIAVLNHGDEAIVPAPYWVSYPDMIKLADAKPAIMLGSAEHDFKITAKQLQNSLNENTRLIILNTPHNPTGTVLRESELRRAVEIAESCGARLLVDETYRGLSYVGTPPHAASLSPRAISISSLSKTWGLPGLRLGWILCRDPELQELFLAAKEQIHISTSVLDEEIACRYLRDRGQHLQRIRGIVDERFACVRAFMAGQSELEWVAPEGGVIAFPRLRGDIDVNRFYQLLNDEYGTFVGPGHWFDMDRRYMRIGYGWPDADELARGLDNIAEAAARASR